VPRESRQALKDIVLIGGSAGSIEALRTIVKDLPENLPCSIFIAIHLSSDYPTMLDVVISRWGGLPVIQPADGDPIRPGNIYIVRPDHHMTLEDGHIRMLRGPRENRHRPAIDPLFRTAAREYGSRVIGIILSGLLDDGSAGLYAVRERGGIAVVQSPLDAIHDQMPSRAIQYAKPQYVLRTGEIAPNLMRLVNSEKVEPDMARSANKAAKGKGTNGKGNGVKPVAKPEENLTVSYPEEGEGTSSVFACPECHGVLWELKDKELVRFRCRVGHSYGADSLRKELSAASEGALWAAMRALEEKAALQRRVADGMAGNKNSGRRLRDQSEADDANARLIRAIIFRRDEKLETEEEAAVHAKKTA
jgi:two-component system, chemotaxis family, protein-glutamate methylesterase/glutaminase